MALMVASQITIFHPNFVLHVQILVNVAQEIVLMAYVSAVVAQLIVGVPLNAALRNVSTINARAITMVLHVQSMRSAVRDIVFLAHGTVYVLVDTMV